MRIVILVDLLRLKAHDEVDASGKAMSYAFGVSFAPTVYPDPADTAIPTVFTPDLLTDQNMHDTLTQRAGALAPWCWTKVGLAVIGQPGGQDLNAIQGAVTPIVLPPPSDLASSDLQKIETAIVAHCVNAIGPVSPNWNPLGPPLQTSSQSSPPSATQDPPVNAFSYPAFIQSAAAWPAPVPHGSFNFVKFFRVAATAIPQPNPTAQPPVNPSIVVFPTFSVVTTTNTTPTGTNVFSSGSTTPPGGVNPLPDPNHLNPVDFYYSTSANLGSSINILVQARCVPCQITPPASTSSFIDLSTLWVSPYGPYAGGKAAISNNAWFEDLPSRLGRAFDLASRLIDALGREDPKAPAGSPPLPAPHDDLRQALLTQAGSSPAQATQLAIKLVLRALHDYLGPATADNASPPSQGAVAQRLIALLPDAGTGGQSLLASLANAQNLPATLQHERDATQWSDAAVWNSDSTQLNPWFARLSNRLSAVGSLPADPVKFLDTLRQTTIVDPDPTKPVLLSTLSSVVALALRPDVLANLIVDTWGARRPDGGSGAGPDLQLVELEIDVRGIIAERGLVVARARRGVLQPAWEAKDGLFQRPASTADDNSDLTLLIQNTTRAFAMYGLGTLAQASTAPAPAPAPGPAPAPDLESAYATRFVRTPLLSTDDRRDKLSAALAAEAQSSLGSDLTVPSILAVTEDAAVPGTVTPGGITLQVDRLIRGPADSGTNQTDDDFHQYLAGYGVLVNVINPAAPPPPPAPNSPLPNTWRSLNVVNIGIGAQNSPSPAVSAPPTNTPPPPATPPLPLIGSDSQPIECVAPLTPVYDGQLPTATVHYDNTPVVGIPNISQRAWGAGGANIATQADPVLVPLQPLPTPAGDTRTPLARLPFLAFGCGVQFASFVVTNHGALPRELADPNFPALLSKTPLLPPTAPPVISPVFPYLRRVAVGPLGLPETISGGQTAGSGQNSSAVLVNSYNAFSFDSSVRLVADELPDTKNATAIDLKAPSQRPMPRAVLLAGMTARQATKTGNSQTKFALRAPSVDIEVFDRWVAFDEFTESDPTKKQKIRDFRKALRDAFDGNSLKQKKAKIVDDYSIGDPAISLFYVNARCIFSKGVRVNPPQQVPQPVTLDWSLTVDQLLAKTATPSPSDTHRPQISITLKLDATPAPNPPPAQRLVADTSPNGIIFSIAEGEVWIVDVCAGVAAVDVNARFDPTIFGLTPSKTNDKNHWLVAPFSFVVECATPRMPVNDEIYRSFTPGLSADQSDITFSWTRTAADPLAAAAVGAINVGWQQWRATGRPPAPFPYDQIVNLDQAPPAGGSGLPNSNATLWDIEAFATRPDEPSKGRRFEPALIPPPNAQGAGPGPQLLASESASPPAPARYLRFQVAAESRYASLYDPPLKSVNGANSSDPWPTPWKRLFRPASPQTVPTLNVRAVVPLTRAIDPVGGNNGAISGVLMVIDGVFGESGGLAENIDIRLVQIDRQLNTFNPPNTQLYSGTEFGADPILRKEATPVADSNLEIIGPIGHTFDIDALAPAFAATSFIVMPPQFAETDPGAWWMAKLKARRVLDPRGVNATRFPASSLSVPASGSTSPPPTVALSGDGDLSLTFDSLALATGSSLTIIITANRAGDPSSSQSAQSGATVSAPSSQSTSTGFPQSWNITLSRTAAATTVAFGNITTNIAAPATLAAVRLLVVTRRVQDVNQSIDLFEATLEAIDSGGTIYRGGEINFEDEPASGAVRLSLTAAGTSQPLSFKTLRAPLASDWSETGWTQFLPDSRVQILPAQNSGAQPQLQLQVQGNGAAIQVTATPSSPAIAWFTPSDLATRRGNDNQGLVHFLLLTSTIPSFAGPQEAYLGLYVLNSVSADGKTAQFSHFGDLTQGGLFGNQGTWRARIMVVQADPRLFTVSVAKWLSSNAVQPSPNAVQGPWDAFFPPEITVGSGIGDANADDALLSPADAMLRILTVFAPFQSAP
jgi:hypothetical protein